MTTERKLTPEQMFDYNLLTLRNQIKADAEDYHLGILTEEEYNRELNISLLNAVKALNPDTYTS